MPSESHNITDLLNKQLEIGLLLIYLNFYFWHYQTLRCLMSCCIVATRAFSKFSERAMWLQVCQIKSCNFDFLDEQLWKYSLWRDLLSQLLHWTHPWGLRALTNRRTHQGIFELSGSGYFNRVVVGLLMGNMLVGKGFTYRYAFFKIENAHQLYSGLLCIQVGISLF